MPHLYKRIYFSFSPFHLLFQIYKKVPQKLMMILPWLTAGAWMSNNAGFTLFFPNGFLQEQQCICTAEQPDWWASGKAGLRSSEPKPGCREWPEPPAAMSLWVCTREEMLPLQQTSFWQAQMSPGVFRGRLGLSPTFEAHWVQFRAHLCLTHCFCQWDD